VRTPLQPWTSYYALDWFVGLRHRHSNIPSLGLAFPQNQSTFRGPREEETFPRQTCPLPSKTRWMSPLLLFPTWHKTPIPKFSCWIPLTDKDVSHADRKRHEVREKENDENHNFGQSDTLCEIQRKDGTGRQFNGT
jgi:hypothetical protein